MTIGIDKLISPIVGDYTNPLDGLANRNNSTYEALDSNTRQNFGATQQKLSRRLAEGVCDAGLNLSGPVGKVKTLKALSRSNTQRKAFLNQLAIDPKTPAWQREFLVPPGYNVESYPSAFSRWFRQSCKYEISVTC